MTHVAIFPAPIWLLLLRLLAVLVRALPPPSRTRRGASPGPARPGTARRRSLSDDEAIDRSVGGVRTADRFPCGSNPPRFEGAIGSIERVGL